MPKYTAYNLTLNSEISFPELISSNNSTRPDIELRIKSKEDLDAIDSDRGQCFVGEIPNACCFAVLEGREILLAPASGIDESILRPLVLGPIISMLLRQRGLLVLHASCISFNNFAVAFLGFSGSGKSTLAEYFHSQGYPVLTDDVMAVDSQLAEPMVIPSFPQIKLWSETARSVGHNPQELPKLHHLSEKLIHRLDRGFLTTGLPLKRIYVLAQGDCHAITELDTSDAFTELIRHCRAISLLNHKSILESHLQQSSALISKVAMRRLQRKMSLDLLPELASLIEQDLKGEITETSQINNRLATFSS